MKKLYSLIVFALLAGSLSAQCTANILLQDSAGYIYGFNMSTGASSYDWWVSDPVGSGTNYTTTDIVHGPVAAGTYTVCLFAYDAGGAFCDSTCSTITVGGSGGGASCNANFSSSASGLTASFTDASSGSAFGSYSYYWDFGDGNTSTVQNPAHTYGAAGTYTVCLTFTDASVPCTDTYCAVVTVSSGSGSGGGSCSMDFSLYDSAGTIYGFNNSTGAAATEWYVWGPSGSMSTYTSWDMTHTTGTSGTYWVCLYGYDSSGAWCDSTCQTISITTGGGSGGSGCAADFVSWPDSSGGHYFYEFSSGTGLSYYWDFGDGNSSTLANPYHAYASPGTYTVCLTVWNSSCADTLCQTITVSSGGSSTPCDADFIWFPDSSSNTVYLWNLGSGPSGLSYYWDFGDGNTSTSAYPMHTYASNGTYTVCLTVTGTTALGGTCSDTYCDSIWVPLKASGFTINVVAPGGPTAIEERPTLTNGLVFPNPVNEAAQIKFSSTYSVSATIAVRSVDGRICSTQTVNVNAGENTFPLNTAELSGGLYLVTISNGSLLGSYKFLKE